jgi:hypothetical protein
VREIVYVEKRAGLMETEHEKRDRQDRVDRRLSAMAPLILPALVLFLGLLNYLRSASWL